MTHFACLGCQIVCLFHARHVYQRPVVNISLFGTQLHASRMRHGQLYGVVPKGLLTFLGSLYKEVAKTTSGTLVYRFERQTARS